MALEAHVVFCRGCGQQIEETAPVCPKCGAPQAVRSASGAAPPVPSAGPFVAGNGMDLSTAVKTCFRKYVVWQGRAARSEYWYFQLFGVFFTVPLTLLGLAIPSMADFFEILANLFALALFLPSLSALVRRLHDTDRSGWWFWLAFLPVVGIVILIVWLCQKGTTGDNRYGSDPLR